jgi:hypothetical protein
LTMTVKLVVGDGGFGAGPPIHVRLVDDVQTEGPITLAAPPKLFARSTATLNKDDASSIEAAASKVEPPPLLPAPAPEPEKKIAVGESVTPAPLATGKAPAPAPTTSTDSAPAVAAPTPNDVQATGRASPIESDVAGDINPATSPYARRNAPDRLQYAERHGGSLKTEAAVSAALAWLANAQSADGRWDASRFGAGVEMAVLGHDRGGAGADADSGISALALLAFLGAGHSHQEGDYRSTVADGLEFLIRGQSSDGHLAADTGLYARMYCHSMATFALAEALAMTGDRRLEPSVRRAVNYSLRAQHPSTGGWRYRIGDTGDTSQLGWQLMSLWSAERAGIEVPPQTWTGAERFLRSVRRGRYGGLASYRPDGPASAPMTAEAMYCRQLIGELLGGSGDVDRPAASEATAQLLASLPEPQRVNLYYWYYGTLALHYQQQSNGDSAAAWQTWNTALTTSLVDSQVVDGADAGSWPPNCVWGGYGGRVYSTAVAAMCLEVYYRYAPDSAQDGWTASRPEIRRLPK